MSGAQWLNAALLAAYLPCQPDLSLIKSTVLHQLLEMLKPLLPLWTRLLNLSHSLWLMETLGWHRCRWLWMDYFHCFPAIPAYFPTVFYTSVTTGSFYATCVAHQPRLWKQRHRGILATLTFYWSSSGQQWHSNIRMSHWSTGGSPKPNTTGTGSGAKRGNKISSKFSK